MPPRTSPPRRSGAAPWPGGRAVVVAGLLVAALTATGCGGDGGSSAGGDAPKVLATTSILADVTDQVACGKLSVEPVVPRGTDPHEFQPTVRDADRLQGAALVVANGLGLEEGLSDSLDRARDGGTTVLEVGPRLGPVEVDGEKDPHVWTDPERMVTAAGLIGERLRRVQGLGVGGDEIARCTAAYQQRLRDLTVDMGATLAAVPPERRSLVTAHESLGYFADRFGFRVVGAAIPSTSSLGEADPRQLDELAAKVRAAGVPAVFGETSAPTKVAAALADRVGSGVQVVELGTEALGPAGSPTATYVDLMEVLADDVATTLGPSSPPPTPSAPTPSSPPPAAAGTPAATSPTAVNPSAAR